MPNPALPRLRVAVMAMCLLMLLGCTAPPPEPKVLTADEAAARTVVPLTRPIALDKAGQVADVEFELPAAAAAEGEVPVLTVGLRVWGEDAKALIAQEDRIDATPLVTRVHLQRVGAGDVVDVPLRYTSLDRRSQHSVGPDGEVPFTTQSSLAVGALWGAGLVDSRRVYGALRIAEASGVEPGRFRLKIALPADRPDLNGLNVELLLTYALRAK